MAHDNLTAAWRALQARAAETRAVPCVRLRDGDPRRGTALRARPSACTSTSPASASTTTGCACSPAWPMPPDCVAHRGHVGRRAINTTEGRAVLHTALRVPAVPRRAGRRSHRAPGARRTRAHADFRRRGARRRDLRLGGTPSHRRQYRNRRVGSRARHGGPGAASAHRRRAARRVVSNVDGTDLANVLENADASSTLFIVASKTFSTQETLANARTARQWLAAKLGEAAVPAHFAAVSTNAQAMDSFGINPNYRFMMWDWVGGRYSLWSSIGVSLAIAIGRAGFLELLAGAHAMDEHFRSEPWERNLPVLMGLLGVWNINCLELPTLAVLPYDGRLGAFPPTCSSSTWRATASR
jgi:glucose-6-phosphate isomerase